jgi:hypothetical protein
MRIILVRGQNFASGGQIFASGGQIFVTRGQIFASLGPNSKKNKFFKKVIFHHFFINFGYLNLTLISYQDKKIFLSSLNGTC